MPFCPECAGEYRQGVQECWVCKVGLVERLDEGGVSKADPTIRLVDVWICDGEAEAQIVRGFLAEQGIDCMLKGEAIRHVHGFSMTPLGKVRIQVRAEDHDRALAGIQESHDVVECGTCGAFVSKGSTVCSSCSAPV